MSLILAMSIFFVVITMIFVTIALLLPEWMGITGKRAKKIIEQQQEEKPQQTAAESEKNNTDSQEKPS